MLHASQSLNELFQLRQRLLRRAVTQLELNSFRLPPTAITLTDQPELGWMDIQAAADGSEDEMALLPQARSAVRSTKAIVSISISI